MKSLSLPILAVLSLIFCPLAFAFSADYMLFSDDEADASAEALMKADPAPPGIERCAFPEPPFVPDGRLASEAELAAAHADMRTYQADMHTSLDCIEDAIDSSGDSANSANNAHNANNTNNEPDTTLTALTLLYNNGVEQLTVILDNFNAQVRAFNDRPRQAE